MYIFQPDRILLLDQIRENAKYIKGRVLDVGAGTYSRYKQFFVFDEYIKMDVREGEGVDIVGSAESIPFTENSMDSVICTQVFEHLKHPTVVAKEIFRVLKKGGYLLVTVPQVNELHEEPNDFFRYTCYGLESLFKDQGFSVVACQRRGGFFSMIAQMKIRYIIDRFKLYQRPLIGRILNKFIKIYGVVMMWFDKIDQSSSNKKHTIGWCIVLKK